MALQIADRVQVTATANTTVSFTLGSAVTGYQSFATAGITNGNTVFYGSSDGTNWEVGIGIYSSTGPTLTRSTILSSSNSGSAVSTFGSSVNVWIDYPSAQAVYNDPINGVVTPSTSIFNNNIVDKQLYLQGGNNLLVQSQTFSNASWTKQYSSVSGSITAPDGTSTATQLIQDTTASVFHRLYIVAQVVIGTTYTFSVYVKANTMSFVQMDLNTGFGGLYNNFNVSTGAIGTGSGVSPTITSVGNGWYRCTITGTATSTGNGECNIVLVLNNTSGAFPTYNGDGTSGLYVWGAQLEAGAQASSYTVTTTAALTVNNNISVPSGSITTSADSTFNTVKVGLGGGSISTSTAVGYQALNATVSGSGNTGVGYTALNKVTSGNWNNAFGYQALNNNTTGTQNNAFGTQALLTNSTSNGNNAFGFVALKLNTGANNSAFGDYALNANTTGNSNCAFGAQSLYNNYTAALNVAIGQQSLYNNTTSSNLTAVGYQSLYNNTTNVATLGTITGGTGYTNGTYTGVVMTLSSGSTATTYPTATIVVSGGAVTTVTLTSNGVGFKDTTTVLTAPAASIGGTGSGFSVPVASLASGTLNTAVGYQAGTALTTGGSLTALGYQAAKAITTGNNNTAIGASALQAATTGNANTVIGLSSGQAMTSAAQNTAVGMFSLYSNTTANNNTALGYTALFNSSASDNTVIGSNAGRSLTSGGFNTIIGSSAGYAGTALTTGQNNVIIGYNAAVSAISDSNSIVIGQGSTGLGSNTTVIGNSSTTQTYIAAGTLNAPQVNATNGLVVNKATIATSYSIPSGSNAMSAGPITVSSGVTVTVPSGSRWVVV